MANNRFKQRGEDEDDGENPFGAGYKLPETKNVTDNLADALRSLHKEEQEEDEKAGKPKKKRPKRQICFCGDPSCGIGPFKETQGGDEET